MPRRQSHLGVPFLRRAILECLAGVQLAVQPEAQLSARLHVTAMVAEARAVESADKI